MEGICVVLMVSVVEVVIAAGIFVLVVVGFVTKVGDTVNVISLSVVTVLVMVLSIEMVTVFPVVVVSVTVVWVAWLAIEVIETGKKVNSY